MIFNCSKNISRISARALTIRFSSVPRIYLLATRRCACWIDFGYWTISIIKKEINVTISNKLLQESILELLRVSNMVVDFSAITKQCDLGSASKWPHLNVASSCYSPGAISSSHLCIAAINARRYLRTQGIYLTKAISLKMPRAVAIDATSFCVCCPNPQKQRFVILCVLPKFPETKICQQLHRPPRASHAQAGHHYIFAAHILNLFCCRYP